MDYPPLEESVAQLQSKDREFAFNVERFRDEDEWLEARRNGIGASDAAVVLGLEHRQSPLSLYHEKLGLEHDEERAGRRRLLRMGLLMEPVIAGLFVDEVKTVELGAFNVERARIPAVGYHLERSSTLPWLTCTVDRWGRDAELPATSLQAAALAPAEYVAEQMVTVELKNVSLWAANDWLDLGEVPLGYQVQVQHQLAVTGAPRGYIAAVIGGVDFKWARIERDNDFIAVLLEKLDEFWRRVQRGDPPPADASDSTKATLNKLRALADVGDETPVELPAEFADLRDQHDALAEQLKELEEKKQGIENSVRDFLIQHNAALGVLRDGRSYSWKMQSRAGYVVEPTKFPVLRRLGGGKKRGKK